MNDKIASDNMNLSYYLEMFKMFIHVFNVFSNLLFDILWKYVKYVFVKILFFNLKYKKE